MTCTINGLPVDKLLVTLPNVGAWYADVHAPVDAALVGRVELKIGTLTLSGTVVAEQSGTFQRTNWLRVLAGAGGWGQLLMAKAYHNDAGVKAQLIAEDAARGCGETLGAFVPEFERVGLDFVRDTGPAARTLERAAGDGIAWWVDYAGVTHVGTRPASTVPADAYHVVAYNPRERRAELSCDDPAAIGIGSVISEHLDEPGTVRELQLRAEGKEIRLLAWLGGSEGAPSRLAGIMRSLAERATDGQLWGSYKYRVVSMAGDGRVNVQPVRKALGLPDIATISMWPGVAGVHAVLTPGVEVLVTFVDGDRAQPVITHFAGKQGTGFVPVQLVLGGTDGELAARLGDTVEVALPPAVFSGTVGGAPATGVLTFPVGKTLGKITSSSGKVKVAT